MDRTPFCVTPHVDAVDSLLPCLRGTLTRLTAYRCAAGDSAEAAAAVEEALRV